MKSRGLRQVLCFVRTKHGASRLARQLEKDGLETSAIHGDKTQGARMDALAAFKEGKLEVLVATDVAARGLDVDDLPLVVNYELPHVPEDYIHRIGRTGRAGATGEAISFVAPEEEKYLADIEHLLKKKITIQTLAGFDPSSASVRTPSPRSRTTHAATRCTRVRAARIARAANAPRCRARRAPAAESRSTREREREEAYARNPDQPPVVRATAEQDAQVRARARPWRPGARAGKARPVPALLMKRKAPEPENA